MRALACLLLLCGCAHSDAAGHYGQSDADTVETHIEDPAERKTLLAGCIARTSLMVSGDGTPAATGDELAHASGFAKKELIYARSNIASCYEAYAVAVGQDEAAPLEERVATALTAEQSILRGEPDPVARMKRAARIAAVAGRLFARQQDCDGAAHASMRAAWYAARASAPEVKRAHEQLVAELEKSEPTMDFGQFLGLVGGVANVAGGVQALGSATSAIDQVQTAVGVAQSVSELGNTLSATGEVASARADLGLIYAGDSALAHAIAPEIEQQLKSIKPCGAEIETALDSFKNEEDAGDAVLALVAQGFGGKLDRSGAAPATTANHKSAPPPAPPQATTATNRGVVAKMTELKALFDQGLIDKKEYEERKKKLLDEGLK